MLGSLNNRPTQAMPRTSADKGLAAASKHFSTDPKYPGVKDPGKTFRQRKANLFSNRQVSEGTDETVVAEKRTGLEFI